MKIDVQKLMEKTAVSVTGNEAWLSNIYKEFPKGPDNVFPKIEAYIEVTPTDYGMVHVTGNVKYSPYVNCCRCDDLIPWKIDVDFDVYFREEEETNSSQKNHDLDPEELDYHFITEGQIDLELFLNEQIQLGIPVRTVPEQDEHGNCKVCLKSMNDSLVFKSESKNEFKAPNPFEQLKKIKFPK